MYQIAWREVEKKHSGVAGGGDVSISFNKSKRTRKPRIRFGFKNKALSAFKDYDFMQISDVTLGQERIYFKPEKSGDNKYTRRVSTATKAGTSKCMSITPKDDREMEIYRRDWVGGNYPLKFDLEWGLNYIEKEAR